MTDGITLDKATYKPGDTITATVVLAARSKSDTITFATAVGNLTTTTKVVADGTLTDSLAHSWKLISDDGVTAVYSTVA